MSRRVKLALLVLKYYLFNTGLLVWSFIPFISWILLMLDQWINAYRTWHKCISGFHLWGIKYVYESVISELLLI